MRRATRLLPPLLRFAVNLSLFLVVLAGLALWGMKEGRLGAAPGWNPFAPLELGAPDTVVQRWKLERALADPALCRAALARDGARLEAVADVVAADPRCGIAGHVRLAGLSRAELAPLSTACPTALLTHLWERRHLRPLAREIYGRELTGIEHMGSYSCRTIAGSRRMSRHARARAIDVSAFRLEGGRRVSLLRGWKGGQEDRQFLRRARDAACEVFGTTLSPDFNAAHADHFHLAVGGWGTCR